MHDERDDALHHVPIEEVDTLQIGDVMVYRVGFKNAKKDISDLETNFGTKT